MLIFYSIRILTSVGSFNVIFIFIGKNYKVQQVGLDTVSFYSILASGIEMKTVFRIHIHWIRNLNPDPNCFLTLPGLNIKLPVIYNYKIFPTKETTERYGTYHNVLRSKIIFWLFIILDHFISPWIRIRTTNPDPEDPLNPDPNHKTITGSGKMTP